MTPPATTTRGAGRDDDVVLRLAGVTKVFEGADTRHVALDGVHLAVSAGSLVALVGHSGSGKSTLLNVAGGLERPSSGAVTLAGVRLDLLPEAGRTAHRRRAVAFVFQEYNLIGTLTALENVCLPLELAGVGGGEARRRAGDALVRLGVARHLAKFPDQLSGGEQQRVAIARALVDRRPLLLADEPTGALDSAHGAQIVALLRAAAADGVACLVATHNPEVAAAADRIVRMRDGRLTDLDWETP
ncbi:MAG TPA: ABC transporter ATP-binding protein [Pilimelia sp.]|nr:ABC transporter ATP-binding protein [Pilimelia sp.]